ncbi:Chitinase II,Glycoside hydrolase, chitinase active site,Glycoside hydrolase superfamily,Glycoside [Cinara cedri]|uniref:Chitinase II,Glycoside hydrolase, chitinase active site,Glycoside hydrolase superfamily,Glycoside n=1 Tax=Cinara cedri TaxID=506608 RepID=A0A5E4N557_9HEMI|nr:Chitinase II,Glycoside hydrolase, chitinase active site,Glycoside hydrolase superfamily,Glycoside [Cinara cedri]
MALGHQSEPQYELLNGKKKYIQPIVHTMVLGGLAVLVIFVVILMFYVSWMKFEDANDQNTPMDFVLFGPQKYTNSDTISYRAHTLAIAAKSNFKTNWTAQYKINLQKRIDKTYHMACYYSIPAENISTSLLPDQIDSHLCTHLIVAFAQVQNNSVYFKSSFDIEILRQVVKLRKKNPDLKVLLSILHFSNGTYSNEGFPGVVENNDNLNKFVNDVVSVIREFYLDGIDIDWEFPSWPLLNLREKYGFSKLLETLHNHLPDSLLTAAVAAPLNIISNSYEIFSLSKFVDFINVMTYDYHSYQWYFPLTGPNSPLFSPKNENGLFQNLNINTSIQYWISKGMPKEKILLGMPTYGHSFKLINEANNGFNSPTSGPGIGIGGFVTFPEIWEVKQNIEFNTGYGGGVRVACDD